MGIFTKEKHVKYRDKEGKPLEKPVVTTNYKQKKSKDADYEKLQLKVKAYEKAKAKENRDKWNKRYKKTAKTVNNALDWLEGSQSTNKPKSTQKPRKKQYVVKNGVAYPVYKPITKQSSKKKAKKSKDPFDFEIRW